MSTLCISITQDDMSTLKNSGYSLCIASKARGEDYTVIWQVYKNFMLQNRVTLEESFRLFACTSFLPGEIVRICTKELDILTGQASILSEEGILLPPTAGREGYITMQNKFGLIHPGISQHGTDLTGSKICSPSYISRTEAIPGICEIPRQSTTAIWFEQNAATGTMLDAGHIVPNRSGGAAESFRSYAFEADLSDTDTLSVQYEQGNWKIL